MVQPWPEGLLVLRAMSARSCSSRGRAERHADLVIVASSASGAGWLEEAVLRMTPPHLVRRVVSSVTSADVAFQSSADSTKRTPRHVSPSMMAATSD